MLTKQSLQKHAVRLFTALGTTQKDVLPRRRLRLQPPPGRWEKCSFSISKRFTATPFRPSAEEDMLVRTLIQDAFNPASASSLSKSGKEMDSSSDQQKDTSFISDSSGCVDSSIMIPNAEDHDKNSAIATVLGRRLGSVTSQALNVGTPSEASRDARRGLGHGGESGLSLSPEGAAEPGTNAREQRAMAERFATIRRKEQGEGSPPALEWLCSVCHTYNPLTSSSSSCLKCKASVTTSYRDRFPPVRHVVIMPTAWVCQSCAHTNRYASSPGQSIADPAAIASAQRKKFICEKCMAPFGGVQNWICPTCESFCPRAATQCPTCYADRPLSWTCHCCQSGLPNSVFSIGCRSCSHERQLRYTNSVVQCVGCRDWNDVRWELCATCMSPLSYQVTSEERGSASNTTTLDARTPSEDAQAHLVNVGLALNTAGVVHSKTVDKAAQILGTLSTGETVPAALRVCHRAEERHRVVKKLPDSAWWCFTCNVVHRRNVTFCDICLEPRDVMRRRNQAELAEMQALSRLPQNEATSPVVFTATMELNDTADATVIPETREGDWQCPYCRKLLRVALKECCGHTREVPNGYWLCDRCCSTNRNDRDACIGCGERQDQVCPWKCQECEWRNDAVTTVCQQCGLPHPTRAPPKSDSKVPVVIDASKSISCPVCSAPNYFEKTACYRCRARLRGVEWTCNACGHGHRNRNVSRCEACNMIREFDLQEEVWLCDVCSTPVFSGGEIPVRVNCPKCNAERASTATHYPCRWKCKCGLFNRSRLTECSECGTRRRLESLDSTAVCPHCYRDTSLDVQETCTHCKGSLASCFQTWESSVTPLTGAVEEMEADGISDDGEEDAFPV